eukprot:7959613-Alexandrium_andersonii.AAC.1
MARSAARPSGWSLRQPWRLQWPPRKATQNCPTRLRARSSSAARAGAPAVGGGGGGGLSLIHISEPTRLALI